MESFFSSLKTARTSPRTYRTREEVKTDVCDYIEPLLLFYSFTPLLLYSFTPLLLYSFTPLLLYSFTPLLLCPFTLLLLYHCKSEHSERRICTWYL
jgi:hypothetical protein